MKTKKAHALEEAAHLREKAKQQEAEGQGLKALRSLLKAASLGDEEAQVTIGYDFAYGITGDVDVPKAIHWWKRAYQKSCSWDAAFNLGMFFRDGQQLKKANKWFERALKAGDEDALIEIAKIHLRYGGDRAEGLRYLELASAANARLTLPARLATESELKKQAGYTMGDLCLMEAELLESRGRFAEACDLLLKGAKAGDAACQCNLGNYLAHGEEGVAMDVESALHWYKKAFDQGYKMGAYNTAKTHQRMGDVDEALRWFTLGVKAGDLSAHLEIAKVMLQRGDVKDAVKHLTLLFSGGLSDLSEQDRDEARTLLRRVASVSQPVG